jgi:hypothetical protein
MFSQFYSYLEGLGTQIKWPTLFLNLGSYGKVKHNRMQGLKPAWPKSNLYGGDP